VLGLSHPDKLACAANLILVLSDPEGEAAAMRADIIVRYQKSLGATHPDTEQFLRR
jgi:hypothetical protein